MAALVGVMNHRGRPALRDGHVQRGHDELGAQVGFHGPADDPPAPRVEHDGEIVKKRRLDNLRVWADSPGRLLLGEEEVRSLGPIASPARGWAYVDDTFAIG